MTRIAHPLLATLLAGAPSLVAAQAVTPADHPGFVLAEAIAAQGCVLHQDDVNTVMEGAGLPGPTFPQFAVPLMRDGFLMSTGNGTLTLVNWGACTGEAPLDAVDAEDDEEGAPDPVENEAEAEDDAPEESDL